MFAYIKGKLEIKANDYIIMPNHVHFICEIKKEIYSLPANQIIPSVVGTLKKNNQ